MGDSNSGARWTTAIRPLLIALAAAAMTATAAVAIGTELTGRDWPS